MKPGYEIVNRGITQGFNVILVYNWYYLNQVDNVRYDNDFLLMPLNNLIAIFKIKTKCGQNGEQTTTG